jgi:signal transduction histidine kinase
MFDEALTWPGRIWSRIKTVGAPLARSAERRGFGLSAKLLLLTIVFVMLAEVLIFVPSVANFRITWLSDRLTAARLAALATQAAGEGNVPDSLRNELLRTAKVRAVSWVRNKERRMVLPPDKQEPIDAVYDFRASARPGGLWNEVSLRARLIWDALAVFFAREDRIIRVLGEPVMTGDELDIVMPEAPLKAAMIRYGLNVLGLSVIISVITAALVYFALNTLFVQPMMRISRNIVAFSRNPEDASRIIVPSKRNDEIGTAERELAQMEAELAQTLHQKNRLAALGLAVSKISHDLRNMLANAQLLSDRLGSLPDPGVQRFAPKLIGSLNRAIALCESTLRFGRAEEAPPRREVTVLRPLVVEVGDGLGLPRENVIAWSIEVDDKLRIDADRDQLFRVLSNLCRNALQAIEQQDMGRGHIRVGATRDGKRVTIDVTDDGPGLPEKARAHLFQAFQGSARAGGTGLGLAVAHELVMAHGGVIRLLETGHGTAFRIEIPDRPS